VLIGRPQPLLYSDPRTFVIAVATADNMLSIDLLILMPNDGGQYEAVRRRWTTKDARSSTVKPRFDAIGLIVSNLTASIAFYRRLGIDLPVQAEHGHVDATLPGGMRLMMDTVEVVRSFDPGWTQPSGSHRIGLAFLCESPIEVDTLYKSLIDEGVEVHKEPWDAFWGQRYAQIKDPDGNVVDLFAPLESQG
jgi:uncharacterized glyoxalase superfamily protein PhnB